MNIMIIGNGFDIQNNILIYFDDFVKSDTFQKQIGNQYKKYFVNNMYRKFSDSSKLWSDFEGYISYITKTYQIQPRYFIKKITLIFQEWMRELRESSKKILPNKTITYILEQYNVDFIISLNYTSTAEAYGFKLKQFNANSTKQDWSNLPKLHNSYVNIHSFGVNKQLNAILGDDSNEFISKSKFISDWGVSEKTRYNPKKLLLSHIQKSDVINKLIIYGYGFGESDKDINNFISNMIHSGVKVINYNKINPGKFWSKLITHHAVI